MSLFLAKWSTYMMEWRHRNGYTRKQFSRNSHIDMRLIRDLEEHLFQSRFYSVASTAEYIRRINIYKQLLHLDVTDPEAYLPLIEKLDSLPPGRRACVQTHYTEYFQLKKEKLESGTKTESS